MNKQEFYRQLAECSNTYDKDNQWFGFQSGGQSWSQGTWEDFILAAWKIYENVSPNQLQLILLGDTKIRSDPCLLMNFGLSSNAKSPQEDKDKVLVSKLMLERRKIASSLHYLAPPVKMMGPGSILSAKRWSPALNDAFVLGGIRKYQGFHFALNEDEQKVWHRLTTRPVVRRANPNPANRSEIPAGIVAKHTEKFGGVKSEHIPYKELNVKETWLKLFQEVPRLLWENGNPRVFARELVGLQLFGYEPIFSHIELGFKYNQKAPQQAPTFKNYLKGLHELGFQDRNKDAIIKNIAKYIFDDENALAGVAY
ncbi:hypothetical protein [Sessilibacter corallicola]|uniref:Uncharacterized protein n=1 Tax=Sessilibacter corallicola TaxID=2904075 RepID=A0ABQ0ABN3_9GAMM